jgi:hypothetical protein
VMKPQPRKAMRRGADIGAIHHTVVGTRGS